jgi:anti-anti-sigma factor
MEAQSEGEVLRILGLESLSGPSADAFKRLVGENLCPLHRVLDVDLSRVRMVDSEGLGALIATRRTLADLGARLRLSHPKPNVRTVLELVQFNKLCEITP